MLLAEQLPDSAYTHIKYFRLTNAIADAMNLVKQANKFFNDTAPWLLKKQGATEKQAASCMPVAKCSVLLDHSISVMPRKMTEIARCSASITALSP